MKKILMLGTGGTIASRQTKDGLAPGLTPEDILSYIPAVKNVCEVQTKQVCNLDSTNVTPEHWKMMVKAVEDNLLQFKNTCHPSFAKWIAQAFPIPREAPVTRICFLFIYKNSFCYL